MYIWAGFWGKGPQVFQTFGWSMLSSARHQQMMGTWEVNGRVFRLLRLIHQSYLFSKWLDRCWRRYWSTYLPIFRWNFDLYIAVAVNMWTSTNARWLLLEKLPPILLGWASPLWFLKFREGITLGWVGTMLLFINTRHHLVVISPIFACWYSFRCVIHFDSWLFWGCWWFDGSKFVFFFVLR